MKRLEKQLKKYDLIEDLIVFGSAVKGKDSPKDIDVAIIMKEKDFVILKDLRSDFPEVHFEIVSSVTDRLALNLIIEGYSISKKVFLRDTLGLKPIKLFLYNLKDFERSKKSLFSMALTKTLKKIKGKRIAPGAVLIPIDQSGYFNEFLDSWKIRYNTSEWTMF